MLTMALAGGCCSSAKQSAHASALVSTAPSLASGKYDADVLAVCDPPAGWKADPLKTDSNHTQEVWVSPTGATAYGVIHFKMPLPLGQNVALQGFLDNMKKEQGEANLIEQQDDPKLPGIRFIAEDHRYRIHTNLIVHSWEGWAIYAGTFVSLPVNPAELQLAEQAREQTKVGGEN
jgi:hypothetical protein